MRLYTLFFVAPRLIFSLGWFFILIFIEEYKRYFVPTILSFLLCIELFLAFTAHSPLVTQLLIPSSTLPQSLSQLQTITISPDQVPALTEFHLNVYRQQPSHRDVLVNLALLSLYQGKPNEFRTYWLEAENLDPNHPIFAE